MSQRVNFLTQAKRLGVLTLTSSLLGLVRELMIARKFGATHATDSYLVALSIPSVLYALFIGSGLNLSVIPRLASLFRRDPDQGMKTFAQFLSVTTLFAALVSILVLAYPGPLIRIFAPGIASSILSSQFTRMLSPLFFFFAASYSLGSLQCARNHTPYWGIIGIAQNAAVVVSVLLLARTLGIWTLIVGTLAGAALALLVQVGLAHAAGFRANWSLPIRGGEAMGMLGTLLPFALVFGVGGDSGTSQADIFLMRCFASRLDPGSITLLALGNKLMGLPVLLIGSAIGLALLPTVSVKFSESNLSGVADGLIQTTSCALLLICPVLVVYLNTSDQIVSAVFGRGAITLAQLVELGGIVRAYSGATVGLTLMYVLSSVLGAIRLTKQLILAGIVTVIFNAILMWILAGLYGARGIAMAISVGSMLYCSILLLLLIRRLGLSTLGRLLKTAAVILGGALGMHLALIATKKINVFPSLPLIGVGIIPASVALILYAGWVTLHREKLGLTEVSNT
jgi:putative peptidoglycan lipid II flippase